MPPYMVQWQCTAVCWFNCIICMPFCHIPGKPRWSKYPDTTAPGDHHTALSGRQTLVEDQNQCHMYTSHIAVSAIINILHIRTLLPILEKSDNGMILTFRGMKGTVTVVVLSKLKKRCLASNSFQMVEIWDPFRKPFWAIMVSMFQRVSFRLKSSKYLVIH